jgi:hypothetical protein
MAKRAASKTVQVKVRMREDMRRKLEREAEARGLTINAEILRRLEQTFEPDWIGGPETRAVLHIIAKQVDLFKQDTSKPAESGGGRYMATARALATLADHMLPDEAKWAGVTMGNTREEGPWYCFPTSYVDGLAKQISNVQEG